MPAKGSKKSKSGRKASFTTTISKSADGIKADINKLYSLETKVSMFEKKSENVFKGEVTGIRAMERRQVAITNLFTKVASDYELAFEAAASFLHPVMANSPAFPKYTIGSVKDTDWKLVAEGLKPGYLPSSATLAGIDKSGSGQEMYTSVKSDLDINDALTAVMTINSSHYKKALKLLGVEKKADSVSKKINVLLKKKLAEEVKEHGAPTEYFNGIAAGELGELVRPMIRGASRVLKTLAEIKTASGSSGKDAISAIIEKMENKAGTGFFSFFGSARDDIKTKIKDARGKLQGQISTLRKISFSMKKKKF